MVTPLKPRTEEEWRTHPLALAMLEGALQANITGTPNRIGILQALGWDLIYHTHDSRRSHAGFLDVCAVRVRDRRLLFAELKTQKKYPTPAQRAWIAALGAVQELVPGSARPLPEVYVWRPSHWLSGEVERVLR